MLSTSSLPEVTTLTGTNSTINSFLSTFYPFSYHQAITHTHTQKRKKKVSEGLPFLVFFYKNPLAEVTVFVALLKIYTVSVTNNNQIQVELYQSVFSS